MKNLVFLTSILITFLFVSLNGYSQELTSEQKEKIISEISTVFEKSIIAAENLDGKLLADCVDDSLQAGFIINGDYFRSFTEVMADFDKKAVGCMSQKMDIINKKITVLGEKMALLTASGNYSLYLEDGRTLTGKFAYSLVYSKLGGNWKIIHSHM
ncbi:MAG: nuclear transport factor 2 family protein [Dysgonomonas sp.]